MQSKTLAQFLEQKPLYYKEIDHKRVHEAFAILKPYIRHPRIVHIVGTNGKGSTGRILAHLAFNVQTNLHIGHYSSPHILRFNERIWLDGVEVCDDVLETAHQKLYAILGRLMSEALSYFEYTTLLALVVFEHCDLIVLEAGLGGEFDATNVCDKELTIITPIGFDHQAFLGDTIKAIATTKINSIQTKALLAPQRYSEVSQVAKEIAKIKNATLFEAENFTNKNSPYQEAMTVIAQQKSWGDFLVQNGLVALKALEILNIPFALESLESLELFGRFYPLEKNIRIDVGHNPLAAQVIFEVMDFDTVLVYNALDDKDHVGILTILKPKIKRVEIIKIDSSRAVKIEAIQETLENLKITYRIFDKTINDSEHYLVFGSFYVVEKFLKEIHNLHHNYEIPNQVWYDGF